MRLNEISNDGQLLFRLCQKLHEKDHLYLLINGFEYKVDDIRVVDHEVQFVVNFQVVEQGPIDEMADHFAIKMKPYATVKRGGKTQDVGPRYGLLHWKIDAHKIPKKSVNESLDNDVMLSMIKRLLRDQTGRLWITLNARPFEVTATKVVHGADGRRFLQVFITGYETFQSAGSAMLSIDDMTQKWQLKKQSNGTYLLSRREVTEAVDHSVPMVVTMLGRLLAAHFKKGERQVWLNDRDWNLRAPITGYQWKAGGLIVRINHDHDNREITYPADLMDQVSLVKNDEEDCWDLRFG